MTKTYTGHKSSSVPLKQWIAEEAMQTKMSPTAIYSRVKKNQYPRLRRHTLNPRTINVQHP